LGTVPHLAAELLQSRAGIKLHHVPYRNGGQLLQDLLSGQVAATWSSAGLIAGHLKDGKVRVLAVAGRRREALLPDVRTMDEAGLKDFRAVAWFALFAPKRTPVEILDRMHGVVQQALAADDVKAAWAEQGAKVELESRADFTRFVDQEIVRWNAIAKAANIQLE
jgi:tripartite-type tricarboxylate transporter receptor subunit TctC